MVAPGTLAAVFDRLDGLPLSVAARELARAGVPVFPCVPGEKTPLVSSGFRRATTDARCVQGWWRWQPEANIGIPTGAVSGLVVIDVDVHGVDGYAAYARAARAGLIPAPLATVTTPTGGQHAYFPAVPGRVQRSWAVGKAGVDCRGDGGYVIAPPSTLRLDGVSVSYRVEQVAAGAVEPVDAVRLRDFLDPPPPCRPARVGGQASGREDADRLAAWLSRQVKGDRNYKLFWAACRLAEGNVPVADALDALVRAEQPDFGEREIARTVYSAYRSVGAGAARRERSASSVSQPAGGFARRTPGPRAGAARGLG
ncbi:bifunctional DNA primase/polymerase [Microbacterium sp. OR21]|uniref:bifunctional DNA primase/polymerase n=1 Tax=Microbacterium sp. OR21 TaxID=3095346 RepID=UPI0039B3DB5F